MLYSGDILKRLINIDDNVENIQKELTLKSCEVEDFTIRQIPKDIVIGKANKVEKHPDADKLVVCQVDCGDKGKYQIITGGENMVSNRYIAVALPGSYLPEIDLKISDRKMRGLQSSGMICSKGELGIKLDLDKHDIWLLDQDFDEYLSDDDLGKSLTDKFAFLDNFVIDVDNKNLTNRADMTGHFGLSIDLFGIYSDTGKIKYNTISQILKNWKNTNIFDVLGMSNKSKIRINSQSQNLRSYIALELNNINVAETDFLLGMYLSDLGQGLVNNWVDFSNYFMNYSGNPVHFFDADKIYGEIIVRQAKEGEKFIDLFENEHILKNTDLVIADDEKILALAGIIGSINSGITKKTKNILVEIANFDPVCVRKTGTRLGLRTDAELRFEKNINPLFTLYTLLLFLDELKYFQKSLGNYEIGGIDFYFNEEYKFLYNKFVQIDFDKIQYFLFGEEKEGFTQNAKNILKNIGFEIYEDKVKVPLRRSPRDINIKEDLYEEVARIYSYENIEEKKLYWNIQDNSLIKEIDLQRKIEDSLINMNFVNVETYPWLDEGILKLMDVDFKKLVQMKNPLISDSSYLRDNLIYSMLGVVQKNFRVYDQIKIFDIGDVWNLGDGIRPNEISKLNFLYYTKNKESWKDDAFLYIKGVFHNLIKDLNLKGKLEFKLADNKISHPKKQAKILLNGNDIAYIASIHPIYFDYFKFPENCEISYVEMNLDTVLNIINNQKSNFGGVDYLSVNDNIFKKDLCFLLDIQESFLGIKNAILNTKGVIDIEIFDIYKGENIPENKKSISITLTIDARDLNSEQVNKVLRKAIENAEKFGAELRK